MNVEHPSLVTPLPSERPLASVLASAFKLELHVPIEIERKLELLGAAIVATPNVKRLSAAAVRDRGS